MTLVTLLGWTLIRRVRLAATESVDESASPDELMDAIREAYFEGEIDTEEYEKVRRRLIPTAEPDPGDPEGPTDPPGPRPAEPGQ